VASERRSVLVARMAVLLEDADVRVAAIYDIHGNLPALEAALSAIDASGADLIVVGGDIAWGPLPRETMERLLTLGARARFIRGDADRDVLASLAAEPDPDDATALTSRWCAEELSEEQREFLRLQAESLAIDVDGLGPTLFCHGSPRSDRDRITVATPAERVRPMLAGVGERVIVCGHTHAQFDRWVGEYRVVNAGSVGLQFGERGAYWAILGPDVDFRRTDYDYEDAVIRILAKPGPVAAKFAERVLAPPPASTAVERWG
jgi:predicted phosphodiesterase